MGVTLPQGDLSDAGAESGIGLGAELQASFSPSLTAYLGVHRYAFSCESGCALGDSPKSTGVGAGFKYIFHNPGDATVRGRAGIVANTLSAEDVPDDWGIGFEVGLGADMPIGTRLYVVPNVGYVSHDAGDGFTAGFFTLGVGLHYHVR